MEIKQLRYYVEIVNCDCNLRKASENLYISPSALSQVIKHFEEEEGVSLFIRSKNKLELTPIGLKLYHNATIILNQFDEQIEDFRVNKEQRTLKVGIPPVLIDALFEDYIAEFIDRYPEIKLCIIEEGARSLVDKTLAKEVELAIFIDPINNPEIAKEYIYADQLAVIVSKQSHFAKYESITLNDINQEKLMLLDETFIIYHTILEEFEKLQLSANVYMTTSQWSFIYKMVARNKCISILPQPFIAEIKSEDIVCIPLKPQIDWLVHVGYLKNNHLSSSAKKFISGISKFIENNNL